ncbi:MAG: peptide ABC transporter substrate-binding protein [Patescibacteria group bacterium]|nr:peptide ABC transporter substrate-binding protein [Patescibacteria group bacterium]MDE2015094.1 peptide ABC transporter substrate-binding protein [Patescibacteria group bacterium]MDE2226522.1 peptide ABC transporter substrate-binding protein [Patescibacteria group bacterium]
MYTLKKIFLALTVKEKVVFVGAAILFIISGLTLFGLGLAKSTEAVPAAGGRYAEGVVGQPIYINPVIASNEIDRGLVKLVFSNIQDIADKIDVSPDGRIWKIRLKTDLHWQDGEKLTSDDVIFTIQKIQDQETNSPFFGEWQGVAAQRLSELELQLSLVNPYAFFSDTLKNLYILPKHLFADVPPANWRLSDYNLKPIGSGPYKFLSYDKRTDGFIYMYRLAAWDKYFGDKSLIQNFDFQLFSNADDLINNFNSGAIDGIAGIEPAEIAQIKRPYENISFRLPNYYAVFLNQSKSVPLKDVAVRQALTLATDKENIINSVLGGRGSIDAGPIPEGAPYYNPGIETATNSLELASATLDAAGWKIDASGTREKTIGKTKVPLELNLSVPQIDFLTQTADILRQEWQRVGFKINIVSQPINDITDNTIKNRDYEMLLFGNVLGRSSDLFSFWHSSERFYPGLNLAIYNNKTADPLIESIRQNLDNTNRTDQFNKLLSIIMNDYPAVFLYSPDYLYLASKNLHGVESGFLSDPSDIFTTANKWYLKTARVLK